jgi:hypothetical protein
VSSEQKKESDKIKSNKFKTDDSGIFIIIQFILKGIAVAGIYYFIETMFNVNGLNIVIKYVNIIIKTIFNGKVLNIIWQILNKIYVSANILIIILSFISTIFILLLYFYLIYNNMIWKKIHRIIKSRRYDLLIDVIVGMILFYFFKEDYISFLGNIFSKLQSEHHIFIIILPLLLFFLVYIRNILIHHNKNFENEKSENHFLEDNEIKSMEEDELNFNEKAVSFADKVFKNKSQNSIVYGIDAPWGTGKSSFINLCKNHWNEKKKGKDSKDLIIYTFNPIKFENQNNLLEKFIEGFIEEIKSNIYCPELKSTVSRYAKLLYTTKPSISLGIFNLSSSFRKGPIEENFNKLEEIIKNIKERIIIIVDDLDRVSNIEEILFILKKAFTLPNVSYILCYDSDKISLSKELNGNDNINEFLEKFINIKTCLYSRSNDLKSYIGSLKSILKQQDEFDVVFGSSGILKNDDSLIHKLILQLEDYVSLENFNDYFPLIGNPRKIKRLINTVKLLDIDRICIENYDYNSKDLLNLLIVYINYPDIFKKIYFEETGEKRGYFSLVRLYDSGYPKDSKDEYENSTYYNKYKEKLNEHQKFILSEIFDKNKRRISILSEDKRETYACFNGSIWQCEYDRSRNLERYLHLITDAATLPKENTQAKKYRNIIDICLMGENIQSILSDNNFFENEETHRMMWTLLSKTNRGKFSPEKSKEIIKYSLEKLPDYSIIEDGKSNIGYRTSHIYNIIKLIENIGWTDEKNEHSYNNSDKNVLRINDWIYGSKNTIENGLLNFLTEEKNGILGFDDLLHFRLYCCSNRSGDTYNIERALLKHSNPEKSIPNDTNRYVKDEMREISQIIFSIFKANYIDKEINIFDKIDELKLDDFIWKNDSSGNNKEKIMCDDSLLVKTKMRIKTFIIFQLGYTKVEHVIGCGFYDPIGKLDEKGINKEINDYLFNICFNSKGEENIDNFNYFVNFFMLNIYSGANGQLTLDDNKVYEVLDKKRACEYWSNAKNIIEKNMNYYENKTVVLENDTTEYTKIIELLKDHFKSVSENNQK